MATFGPHLGGAFAFAAKDFDAPGRGWSAGAEKHRRKKTASGAVCENRMD